MHISDDLDITSRPKRAAGNFYGRRKAQPLTKLQEQAYQDLLPKLRLDLSKPSPTHLSNLFNHSPKEIILEIGFGGGEHLLHRAKLHEDIGFIGCEPFINGIAKAAAGIQRDKLTNITLYDEDATELLKWLPTNSLSRLDLFYPDPWPKKRHWKRRFLNKENLGQFHRVLKVGGEFRFASDIESYVNWTLAHVTKQGGFSWQVNNADDWHQPWDEWISTRYEQKALREGRVPAYFIFNKKV